MGVLWRDASAYAGAGYLVDRKRGAYSAFGIYLNFNVFFFAQSMQASTESVMCNTAGEDA